MEAHFHLKLSARKYREYYAGNVSMIQVTSDDGRSIRFPARVLQPFLTHSGIEGAFVIRFDDNHKLLSIDRLY